jgi:aryl-alcohol dehydrogenase-like predicted oxidoreductase
VAILDRFHLLGRSGLRVSPLSLGTMTFGTEWGWGAEKEVCRRIFDRYIEAGGNFIDTANFYTEGTSEMWTGEFIRGRQHQLVIATKYAMCMRPGDANAGGIHRKNLVQSLEASLRRLRLEAVDLLWVHAWDFTVPVDELMRALDDVVSAGKVHYVGVSNAPAWVIANANTLASLRGWAPFIGMQMQYSLIERSVEREILPMGRELKVGMQAWSPLAGGFLSGKYARAEAGSNEPLDQTLRMASSKGRVNDRNLGILRVVQAVAKEIGRSEAQVAIRWVLQRPGVNGVVLGARTADQLDDNLAVATFELTKEQMARLDDVSKPELGYPHSYLASGTIMKFLYGGANIE